MDTSSRNYRIKECCNSQCYNLIYVAPHHYYQVDLCERCSSKQHDKEKDGMDYCIRKVWEPKANEPVALIRKSDDVEIALRRYGGEDEHYFELKSAATGGLKPWLKRDYYLKPITQEGE